MESAQLWRLRFFVEYFFFGLEELQEFTVIFYMNRDILQFYLLFLSFSCTLC